MGPCQTYTDEAEIKQFSYFTDRFKDESYQIESLTIDDAALTALTHVRCHDRFHVPHLLLERMVQSIGFVAIQHIRRQQQRPLRFIFIRGMHWWFSGPVRPSLPVFIKAGFVCRDETANKQSFVVRGTVNSGVRFSMAVDVIGIKRESSSRAPGGLHNVTGEA
ncbi:hypothetical protein Brsp05_04536 [Brucella sp. NBRC 12953]|uniref:hypothetical protein n=1 Tax=Brucella sp. NBRC 12953 TaxID=3075481 RepID=UPI0030AE6C37